MADPNPQEAAAPAKKRRLPLIAAIAVLVLGGGGAAAWWFLGRGAGHEAGADGAAPATPAAEPIYAAIDPPFVVNFQASGHVRFLQIAVQAMSRDPATIELLKRHDPVIRNALLLLFAGRSYESLATREGKEALRRSALEELRKIVTEHGGDGATLEDVYFTSFVMQ
jgi:flagellar FliL protein